MINSCYCNSRIKQIKDNQFQCLFEGYNLAVCSYPGYEYSKGEPSDESLRTMGLTVYDYLASMNFVVANKIYLWGFSIGTGVANYVAANRPVHGLLLMAPYSNGYDLFNNFLNIFHGPGRLLVGYHMDAEEYAESVLVKPCILASVSDEIVSYSSSSNLSQKYPAGSAFLTFHGIGHNEFWYTSETQEAIKKYFGGELNR